MMSSGIGTSHVNTELLLANTEAFINTMYAVKEDFNLSPIKDHIATCINYSDLLEMREDFVEELVHSVSEFVYSRSKQDKLISDFVKGRDSTAANSKLIKKAKQKFRTSYLQGQFSELLLFNLIQHYFKAVPLLRKMSLTTNVEVERHGADAVHIAQRDGKYYLYIGEAKTYNPSKNKGFKSAIDNAINDIVTKHYVNHRKELKLYAYEEFLPSELEEVADSYLSGSWSNFEVHLVCIVTYDLKRTAFGYSREEILEDIIDEVRQEMKKIGDRKAFKSVPIQLIPRLNFIVFPVQEMDALIELFKDELGVKSNDK